jgi:hypothetical protein
MLINFKILPDKKSVLGFKAEYYAQKGVDNPADAIGAQRSMDLFPEVSAFVGQVLWAF